MRRRRFIAALGGAAFAWPLAASAQQKALPVIGFLGSASPDSYAQFVGAFRQGLSDAGYVEDQNLKIEYRWAEGRYDRLPAMATDLVTRKVDLIVASGGNVSALAAKKATSTIPIVFASGGDPIASGLVAGLARPGGNVTGITFLIAELAPKRLDLLSQLVPQARTIALLTNPNSPGTGRMVQDVQEAARAKGIQLPILKASTEGEIDAAFATLIEQHVGALVVGADPFFFSRRKQFVALASRQAVPAIYQAREFVAAGGLISYGASLTAVYRQLANYASKILRGERPADLPVQQSDRFELVINLKTAGALGLTVPQSIFARADEVIE